MTRSEAPKALQGSECNELLDPIAKSLWIVAQHWPKGLYEPAPINQHTHTHIHKHAGLERLALERGSRGCVCHAFVVHRGCTAPSRGAVRQRQLPGRPRVLFTRPGKKCICLVDRWRRRTDARAFPQTAVSHKGAAALNPRPRPMRCALASRSERTIGTIASSISSSASGARPPTSRPTR